MTEETRATTTQPQTQTPPAATPEKGAMPEHLRVEVKTDKVRTPGWKLFDKIVHGGITFGLNVTMALLQSHDQINYEIGKEIDKVTEKSGKGIALSREEQGFLGKTKPKVFLENALKIPFTSKLSKDGKNLGYFSFADHVTEVMKKAFGKLSKTGKMYGDDGKAVNPDLEVYAGIAGDVLTLSNPGHVATAITQIFENKHVKPKMVRWLDKWIDERNAKKGKAPTEQELAERQAVYKKLDTELSGKSFLQVWSARFVGIAVVIGTLIGLGKLDRAITKVEWKYAGLNRIKQGSLALGGFASRKLGDSSPKWLTAATSKEIDSPQAFYSQRMLALIGTEVTGSSITAGAQYMTLMFKELFGKKEKKTETTKPAGAPITPEAQAKVEAKVEATQTTPAQAQEAERVAYAEKVGSKADKKPEPSADFREAVVKTTGAQEMAFAGA